MSRRPPRRPAGRGAGRRAVAPGGGGGLAQEVRVDPCRLRVPGADDEAVVKGTGAGGRRRRRLAGDDGLRILEGRPGDAAEVRHPETGPPAVGQVLAAVDGLVRDSRKANTVRRTVLWSPGAMEYHGRR